MGTTKGGAFDIPEDLRLNCFARPIRMAYPTPMLCGPWVNGMDLTQRPSGTWIIDFGVDSVRKRGRERTRRRSSMSKHVKPQRDRTIGRPIATIGGFMLQPGRRCARRLRH